jgi:hypothetical protein
MAKHKYLFNFDCFSLQSNAFLAHWIVVTPIVFKEGKVIDPKKVEALVNMQVLTILQETHVFNGMP